MRDYSMKFFEMFSSSVSFLLKRFFHCAAASLITETGLYSSSLIFACGFFLVFVFYVFFSVQIKTPKKEIKRSERKIMRKVRK